MIYFDIETKANEKALKFLEEPTPPSNYKNPETIARYIEEKKVEQIERAALDADYGMVVAIGVKENDGNIQSKLVDVDATEKELIEWFWELYTKHSGQSCGYNIIGFDLPYLLRRSFELRVILPVACKPDLRRYQTYPTCDLMNILYNWGSPRGLKWVCERYGIKNPLPELDGSQVKDMDAQTLRAYVENDVNLIYGLFHRMQGVYF